MRYLLVVLVTLTILFVPEYPVYAQAPTSPNIGSSVRNFEHQEVLEKDRMASGSGKFRQELGSDTAHLGRDLKQDLRLDEQKFASEEARLKLKIAAWRDQKKAARVAKINQELQQLNQQITGRMTQQLTYMSNRLTLLQNTGATASGGLRNVQAIQDAQVAITTAQAAVTVQAAKTYSINVSSEQNAKIDAKTARDNLVKDLKALQSTLMVAKQAVVKAYMANGQQI